MEDGGAACIHAPLRQKSKAGTLVQNSYAVSEVVEQPAGKIFPLMPYCTGTNSYVMVEDEPEVVEVSTPTSLENRKIFDSTNEMVTLWGGGGEQPAGKI